MNEKLKGLSIIALISILAIVLASAGISGVTATSKDPAHSDSDFVPNEVIVGFDKSVTIQDQDATIQDYGGKILKRNEAINSVLVSVKDEQAFINKITKEPSVKYAERNGIYHVISPPDVDTTEPPVDSEYTQPTLNDVAKQRGSPSTFPPDVEELELPEGVELIQHTPIDPLWGSQWGPQSIKCPEAWDIEKGSLDVLIAIVDTGIDYNHEDLTHYVAGGYDWYNSDSDPMDDHSHGTHCAGIAAATMDNSKGIAGVAQVGVMAEKVCSAGGSCPWFDCANGVTHAADFGADVISMSFGGSSSSSALQTACQYAWNKNVVLVAASGNSGGTPVSYPARFTTVICVGSIGPSDTRSSFSQYGPSMELVAPGEDIISTILGDAYGYKSGTSMSTPHVAGVAALVISQNPSWANSVVRTQLTDTAVDLGATGWDQYYGDGKVDAYAALSGIGGPGKAVLIYPAEDIYFDTTPTYTWVRVIDSTWYYLWVNGPSGKIFGKWYQASGICSEQTCSVTPSITLSGGGYKWWIQTWNSGGYGPWSDCMDFSVCPPGKATLKSPSGITTDRDPEYSWDKALGSTWCG
jgi:subtilisin family serine protease